MIPTRKVTVGMYSTQLSRRRRKAMSLFAGVALAVPITMISGASANVANLADNASLPQAPVFSPFAAPVPPVLGATGASPHDSSLSPQLLHNAGNQAALLTSVGPLANVPSGPLGIPGIVLQAYLRAQQTLAVTDPSCHLPWWLLAGIGKIESGQAENGEVDAAGNTLRPILGPVLNGTNGSAAIPATPNSYQWTGDPTWERAVGPMQFLPSTWQEYGAGGNPNNVFDAALAAGRYLCNGGRDLADPAQQAIAVFSYNHSNSYVAEVLLWANAYAKGVTPLAETVVTPQPTTFTPRVTTTGAPPPPTTSGSTTPSVPGSSSSSKPPSSSSSTQPTSSTKPTSSTPPSCTTTPTTTTTTTTTTGTPTSTTSPPSSSTTSPPSATSPTGLPPCGTTGSGSGSPAGAGNNVVPTT